jgi:hypothetical protein
LFPNVPTYSSQVLLQCVYKYFCTFSSSYPVLIPASSISHSFSVHSESRPGVSVPSTCYFVSQSALLTAIPSIVLFSAVQRTGYTPTGATYTSSSHPEILHRPFKCGGTHTLHVLPMEDVCRELIHDMIYSSLLLKLGDLQISGLVSTEDFQSTNQQAQIGLRSIIEQH